MRGKIYVLVLPRDSEAIRAVYDRFHNQDNLPFFGRFFWYGEDSGGSVLRPLPPRIQNPKPKKSKEKPALPLLDKAGGFALNCGQWAGCYQHPADESQKVCSG